MLYSLLLLADQATGQEGGGNPNAGNPLGGLGGMLPSLLLILVVGYFLMIRPMQRQEKQRQALIAGVKKNDRIVNQGGIIGVVESIKDEEVLLKGGLRVTKSSIVKVIPPEGATEQKEGGA
jgi:preprotein translocase subunit YajC